MKRPIPFPSDFSETTPPVKTGDLVYINHEFSNGIGGKRAIVESCAPNSEMHSGWAVKIDKYEKPIDSGWLTKIPVV
jgi:hypothetical protein